MRRHIHVRGNGIIVVSQKEEIEGLIRVGAADSRRELDRILSWARLAYDGKTWLVPGVAEASYPDHAKSALRSWTDWVFKSRRAA